MHPLGSVSERQKMTTVLQRSPTATQCSAQVPAYSRPTRLAVRSVPRLKASPVSENCGLLHALLERHTAPKPSPQATAAAAEAMYIHIPVYDRLEVARNRAAIWPFVAGPHLGKLQLVLK